jgi:hypothetical protein
MLVREKGYEKLKQSKDEMVRTIFDRMVGEIGSRRLLTSLPGIKKNLDSLNVSATCRILESRG